MFKKNPPTPLYTLLTLLLVALFSTAGFTSSHLNISWLKPTQDTSFYQGETIGLQVFAENSEGPIQEVRFFIGGLQISTQKSAPYSLDLAGLGLGWHDLSAEVVDTSGVVKRSTIRIIEIIPNPESISIFWSDSSEALPSIGLNELIEFDFFLNILQIDIEKVELMVDGMVIDKTLQSPFHFTYSGSSPGTFKVKARVTTASGFQAETLAKLLEIIPDPNTAPTAFINYAEPVAPSAPYIFKGVGKDLDGTISKLELHINGSMVGRVFNQDSFSFEIDALPGGINEAFVIAYDNVGASGNSDTLFVSIFTTGILSSSNKQKAYPNPVVNKQITLEGFQGDYTLINSLGQNVQELHITTSIFTLQLPQPAGTYFLIGEGVNEAILIQ
ncbi:MAG: hypothetical protein ACJAY8_000270 [Sphingobacteriales bacterium]|jgi:hypothetical protein